MKNEMIEIIYNNLINEFKKNIPEDEKENLSKLFKDRVSAKVNKIKEPITKNKREFNISFIIQQEKDLCNSSLEYKKAVLIKDEQYEQINYLSLNAYALARKKLNDNETISVEDANKKIEFLEKMLESVQDFNKQQAQMEVSEAILDLKYASGQVDDIFSLRMGREIQNKMSISK